MVVDTESYELIDAGDERRLERFGPYIVDRPASAAWHRPLAPEAWQRADLTFEAEVGWRARDGDAPAPWNVAVAGVTLELRPTRSGQVGLFPEHAAHVGWLTSAAKSRGGDAERAAVLHLFAYTGLTTLALARSGAAVAHVDAQRSAVSWARRNAQLSGLADAPVRWLVDDALAFTEREARRGRWYDGIVLDPPTYGHADGRAWRIGPDLPRLLSACARIATDDAFILLTAHDEGGDASALADALADAFPRRPLPATGELGLAASSGAVLPLGWWARLG